MFLRSRTDEVPFRADSEILGSYQLVSEIACGELTTVFRAHPRGSKDMPQDCAVKLLQHKHANDAERRAVLLAAGRVGLALRSPYLVRVLAVHEEPLPFVVMEYVPGMSLAALLSLVSGPEVARYVLPILVDALLGLQALHTEAATSGAKAALVHGAPCARHILIGRDGVGRLVDLTHAVGPGLPWSARRDDWLRPDEMAPEQALAPAHVDARCDLFILGAVLWQTLAGEPLFSADNHEAALQSMLRKTILAPGERGGGFGGGLDRVCRRALQRARGERYASAAQMAAELREESERARLYATPEEIGTLVERWQARAAARVQLLAGGPALRSAHHPLNAPATRSTLLGLGIPEGDGGSAKPIAFRPSRPGGARVWAANPAAPEAPSGAAAATANLAPANDASAEPARAPEPLMRAEWSEPGRRAAPDATLASAVAEPAPWLSRSTWAASAAHLDLSDAPAARHAARVPARAVRARGGRWLGVMLGGAAAAVLSLVTTGGPHGSSEYPAGTHEAELRAQPLATPERSGPADSAPDLAVAETPDVAALETASASTTGAEQAAALEPPPLTPTSLTATKGPARQRRSAAETPELPASVRPTDLPRVEPLPQNPY